MSTSYYNQKWQSAIGRLLQNISEENYPLEQNKHNKGITYKRSDYQWFQYYGALYIRYVTIYRDLQDAYDQMVHPQKRLLMKEMLENTIVRMCEVKQNAIKFSTHPSNPQSDFINLDQILMDLKLTPKHLNIPVPKHYSQSNSRDQVLKEIHKDLAISQQVQIYTDAVTLDTNLQTAIRIIQKLQRGRQGIIRGLSFFKMRNKVKDRTPQSTANDQDQKVIIIQKYWRSYLARKKLKKMKEDQLKFLGIIKEPLPKNITEQVQKTRKQMKIVQKIRQQKFNSQRPQLVDQIKKIQQPSIKQQMLDQRRKWIKKFMQMHQFSNVPKNSQQFYKVKQQQPDISQKKGQKKGQGKQNKGPGKKNQIQKFIDQHISLGPSETVVKIQENINKYTQKWGNRDQSEVVDQIYDVQLAKDQLRPDIENDLQKLVDDMINMELDGMRIKYGIKKNKQKKARKKPKKAKKVKIPQGLNKRTPRQLLQQLYQKNIAKILSPAKFSQMIGQHNTVTYLVQKNSQYLPDPSVCQVKNLVVEYIGLPLGSQVAKDKLQKWGWFMFYGAMGTGKTLALRALQHETNSVVFDLTPDNVKQRYSEKSQLTRLLWSVIICAQQFQPSIIMIDDFQTIFGVAKGKKKDGVPSFGPKMKKIIADLKKNKLWTKNDRIAVIGCSNKPYDATLKDCKKIFDKKIYFPFPNYATRKQLIKHFIQQKIGKPLQNFPYQTLAHVSEGFTAGSFKNCIDKVLSNFRIQRIKDQPLRINQFIHPLSSTLCVFAGQYEKLRKFTDDVTGLRQKKQARKQQTKDDKKK